MAFAPAAELSMDGLLALLEAKRAEIVERWLRRVERHCAPEGLLPAELRDHLPVFFDQLVVALRRNHGGENERMAVSSQHGEQRLRAGFDVDEVVLEYGLLGTTILEFAEAEGLTPSTHDVRVLHDLLNVGTGDAVGAYVRRRDEEAKRQAGDHIAFIAHELRNPLSAAATAFKVLRGTALAEGGTLVDLVGRNLGRLRDLVEQMLTAERLAKIGLHVERVDVRDVLANVAADAAPAADVKGVHLALDAQGDLTVDGDRRLLHSVVTNLIGNAIKFSRPAGTVAVHARRVKDRVRVAVEDACGGLPPTSPADLFEPYVQRGEDRSGLGLGLAIVKQAVEAHGGTVGLQNRPGVGCVFTFDVPAERQ